MTNGTHTLKLALEAMGIGPGDEVIVPGSTCQATASSVLDVNAVPILTDVDPNTWCLDPKKVEENITSRTKCIIPVHLYGRVADMDAIMALANKYNLKVIEDCAHAHGGEWDGKHVGTLGDVGSFSFQQSKLMSSGEGGCCITDDDDIADTLGRLSHIGYQYGSKQGQKGTPPPIGLLCHNYRVTDFQAEILLSQLAHLREDTIARANNAEILRKRLNAIPGVQVQAAGRKATLQSYYTYCVLIDHNRIKEGFSRADILKAIQAEGVIAYEGWGAPMYRQNLWTVPENMYRTDGCAVAENIIANDLTMMNLQYLMLSEADTHKVADAYEKVLNVYFEK
jgi:L-glutamine:2-deoxy-scyllo-inosose/3-amino-2,3-dideoxy-scyllo-inosose aminotransferase